MSSIDRKVMMAIRSSLITKLAEEFEASGIEYTCRAVVTDFARKRIVPLTQNLPAGYLVQPSFAVRRIERDVADEIHRRWAAA